MSTFKIGEFIKHRTDDKTKWIIDDLVENKAICTNCQGNVVTTAEFPLTSIDSWYPKVPSKPLIGPRISGAFQ